MLIIEDESMVGMLIEDMLGDLGCVVAGAAAQLDDAVRQVSTLEFDVRSWTSISTAHPAFPLPWC